MSVDLFGWIGAIGLAVIVGVVLLRQFRRYGVPDPVFAGVAGGLAVRPCPVDAQNLCFVRK